MTHVRKADLRTLDEFADYLQDACKKHGILPLTPFNSRKFASAPDKTEFAAHEGVDILQLESKGVYSPDSDNATYARLLEARLNEDFWPSNNTAQLGLPSMEPLPELGTDERPLSVGELPSSISRYLQQTPPNDLRALAALLLGGVARAKSRDPNKRPKDSFEPNSRKTKSGRRDYAKVPTFEQWATRGGIKLTWLSNNAVQEGTKVYNRLLEDILVTNFWPRHRSDERKRGGIDRAVPILEKQTRAPPPDAARDRILQPGSVTLDARRNPRLETLADLQAPKGEGKLTGDLGKVTLWLEQSFIDYDPVAMKIFLQRFPRTTLGNVLEVAQTMWRQADGKQSDARYVNFQRFLHRLSAVDALKSVRPQWSSEELQNYVYFELNHVYATVSAGCQAVCNKPLDPYDLASKISAMPTILEMNNAEVAAAVQRVTTVAARAAQTVSPQQYMEAIAAAVRQGGASREQQDNVLALVKEMKGAELAEPEQAPFAAPPPMGVGGDTLYALQNQRFGLKSTQEMVRNAMRRGLDPPPVEGPGWVMPSGIGGGDIDGHRRKENLLKAQVEEAIRQIRADYGVDAGRAKYVQEQINKHRGARDVLGDTGRTGTRAPHSDMEKLIARERRLLTAERKRLRDV